MAAPKGNRFWEIRKTHGRDPAFSSPEQMWEDCVAYFAWCEDNPLIESKPFAFQGTAFLEQVPKMRAMTVTGLCVFLGIGRSTWEDYKKKKDFSVIMQDVEQVIYEQKFTGAAADLLNANIIARELGLADKKDHQSTDGSMAPKESKTIVANMDPMEATRLYQEAMNGTPKD